MLYYNIQYYDVVKSGVLVCSRHAPGYFKIPFVEEVGVCVCVCVCVKINMYNQCIVQLILNFTHMCQYTNMPAHLLHVKHKNLARTYTVACNFSVCITASKYDCVLYSANNLQI